jgi:predicted exporter
MESREHGGPLVARSALMGVLVSGLTTITGFGTLLLAQHRGIYGLGLLLTLGSVTSLIAALIVLPVLLQILERRRRRPPADPSRPSRGEPAEPALERGRP